LGDYGLRWESTSLVYRFVEPPLAALLGPAGARLDPRLAGRCVVLAAWIAAGVVAWRRRFDALRASWTLLGAYLVLSPTAAMPLCYWILERWQREGVWLEPAWLWPALALPFFALLAARARKAGR
jgi:hypothetical protein